MNRRDFIKRAFGLAVAVSLPSTLTKIIPDEPTGNVWIKPEQIAEEALYYLGKGTLYFQKNNTQITFPCVEFSIHKQELEKKAKEIDTSISFTLDEINQDSLKLLLEGESNEIG